MRKGLFFYTDLFCIILSWQSSNIMAQYAFIQNLCKVLYYHSLTEEKLKATCVVLFPFKMFLCSAICLIVVLNKTWSTCIVNKTALSIIYVALSMCINNSIELHATTTVDLELQYDLHACLWLVLHEKSICASKLTAVNHAMLDFFILYWSFWRLFKLTELNCVFIPTQCILLRLLRIFLLDKPDMLKKKTTTTGKRHDMANHSIFVTPRSILQFLRS